MDLLARIADGRTDLILSHLRSGGSANAQDARGTPLLAWTAYYGDVTALATLIDAGAKLDSLGPNYDLNGAAFHGHWQLCQFLIEGGANPGYALPENGETALHAATCHPGLARYDVVVEVLLAAGAAPSARTDVGAETGSFMRDVRTAGETPLHRAAAFGSPRMVQMLIDAGGDITARDAHGDSPLSWASRHCRPDALLRLLLFGEHRIHPERDSRADHGQGPSAMESYLLGKPHAPSAG